MVVVVDVADWRCGHRHDHRLTQYTFLFQTACRFKVVAGLRESINLLMRHCSCCTVCGLPASSSAKSIMSDRSLPQIWYCISYVQR